jgi:chemotaxis protein methyltransferase WspC
MLEIEKMLRERMGLDGSSIGSSLIQRTVRLRMRDLGIKKAADYERLLKNSAREWSELVESVIVTETWFFRDQEPFLILSKLVVDEWFRGNRSGPAQILSVPCSSGEEPYSIVMALRDVGVPEDRFRVDAIDISERTLARARCGIYGKNSFRTKDLSFRSRYFSSAKEGFALHPEIVRNVNFYQGNILDEALVMGGGNYDFIFCRNLLIYFDRATQANALRRLSQFLSPNGVLFVGPAELPLALENQFVSANLPMAFACRKASHAPHSLESRAVSRAAAILPPVSSSEPAKKPLQKTPKLPATAVTVKGLEEIRGLADTGRLSEALAACQTYLRQSGPCPHGYYLMGLLQDAAGDVGALDSYRRALYLDPNHYETLLQLALLLEKNGDSARARTFKNRAQRLKLAPK